MEIYPTVAKLLYMAAVAAAALYGLMVAANRPAESRAALTRQSIGMAVGLTLVLALTSVGIALAVRAREIDPVLAGLLPTQWMMLFFAFMVAPAGMLLDPAARIGPLGKIPPRLAVPAATLFIIGFSAAWYAVAKSFGAKEEQLFDGILKSNLALGLFIPIALLAPFVEEILFRLGVQTFVADRLARRGLPTGSAIIVASLFWTLGHAGMMTPDGAKEGQIFVIGLVLGWLRQRYGIGAAIVAHLGLNASAVLAQIVVRMAGWET